jgi:hypothetical protein
MMMMMTMTLMFLMRQLRPRMIVTTMSLTPKSNSRNWSSFEFTNEKGFAIPNHLKRLKLRHLTFYNIYT